MLKLLSHSDASRLRDFFLSAGYTQSGLRQTLSTAEFPSRRLRNLPRLLHMTREPSILHTLMRWFVTGTQLETDAAQGLIPDWAIALFLESGLLVRQGEALVPAVTIMPLDSLLFVTDPALKIELGEERDIVLALNPTTWVLYRFIIRRPSRATLDLGAGCGVQALAMASFSQSVVATDLNPRAIEFAAFNTRLNGIPNVECLMGDSFQPVAGRTFDLIVSNPPFFITPSNRYLYCDNELGLDLFCRRLVKQAPDYLNEGGYLQMVCEWAQLRGQSWQDKLGEWLEGTGCDAWIMKEYTESPAAYAQIRIGETTAYSPEAEVARYSEWMGYYDEKGVEAVHGGLVALRKRSGRNWIRIDELARRPHGMFGDSVLQIFAAQDFLQSHSTDADMLSVKPKLSPNVILDQQSRPDGGNWRAVLLKLRLTSDPAFEIGLQPLVAEFVGQCDGTHTLAELIRDLAAKVSATPDQVARECLAVVRKLIERGFMLF